MLSTNYKIGKKRENKAALYFLHFFEGFDFKQFYFQVKGVQPAAWESEFAAGFCQNAFCDGLAASAVHLRSQQPQSAVDFKESMGLPWAGCGHQVSMALEARPL